MYLLKVNTNRRAYRLVIRNMVLAVGLMAAMAIPFTAVSASDFTPDKAIEQQAEQMARAYLDAINAGDFAAAFAMHTKALQSLSPYDNWQPMAADGHALRGDFIHFSNLRITWYDNPSDAAQPGLYAAFDFQCAYENTAICLMTLILHSLDGENFAIMRHEITQVTQDEAEALRQQSSNDK